VLWVALVGVLLAGIVALNVAVLRLTTEADRLDAEIQQLETDNSRLLSELAGAAASSRIQAGASQLGLVEPVDRRYLELDPNRP
jgi:cell division protein FtsL